MSGSVYEMIGRDPQAMVQKAGLVLTLHKTIVAQALSHDEVAARLGISSTQLELVLGGRFREIPAEQLLAWLRELGYTVDVRLTPPAGQQPEPGQLLINPLPHQS